jgi:hypothetical protein
VNLGSYPSIAIALAAERHHRLLADADHRRRLAQVPRGWGRESAAAWLLRAVRGKSMTASTRIGAWRARHPQWSLAGES